jgi:hypothetical protein
MMAANSYKKSRWDTWRAWRALASALLTGWGDPYSFAFLVPRTDRITMRFSVLKHGRFGLPQTVTQNTEAVKRRDRVPKWELANHPGARTFKNADVGEMQEKSDQKGTG